MPVFSVKKICSKCDGCGQLVTGMIIEWAKYGLVKEVPKQSIKTCDLCNGSGIVYSQEYVCQEYINKQLEKGKSMSTVVSKIEDDE